MQVPDLERAGDGKKPGQTGGGYISQGSVEMMLLNGQSVGSRDWCRLINYTESKGKVFAV